MQCVDCLIHACYDFTANVYTYIFLPCSWLPLHSPSLAFYYGMPDVQIHSLHSMSHWQPGGWCCGWRTRTEKETEVLLHGHWPGIMIVIETSGLEAMTFFKDLGQHTNFENWKLLLYSGEKSHACTVLRPPVHKTFSNRGFHWSHSVEDVV